MGELEGAPTIMFDILIKDILPIFVIMALGYAAGKRGVFSAANAQIFNKLVLTYALPAALFVSIVKANRTMLFDDGKLLIISLVILVSLFLLSYLSTYKLFKHTRSEAAVSALITGSPTIGFAVLSPIYGDTASTGLVIAIVSIVVNAVSIPIGMALLNAGQAATATTTANGAAAKKGNPVLDALKAPVCWAPILAVILVLCGIKFPPILEPNFELIAKANHIPYRCIESHSELDEAIKQMHESEGAFLLEVRVEREENVFPMVPAGAPVHDIRLE